MKSRLNGLQQAGIERKQMEVVLRDALKESEQNRAKISALLESARAILKYREFKDAARAIFDSCKNLIGATAGYVALLSKDGTLNEVLFLDSGGLPCSVDPSLPMPIRGLRGDAYRSGKAVYENDFPKSKWVEYMPEGHVKLDNALFAPLMLEGKVVGLLGLANKPGGFTEHDAEMALTFSELASVALLMNSRTLELLKDSEERFHQLSDASFEGIAIHEKGRIIEANHTFAEIFGYENSEIIGMHAMDFVVPEHRDLLLQHILSGSEKPLEAVGLRKDGSTIVIEARGRIIPYRGRNVQITAIRDITERKKAEEKLLKKHLELSSLYDISAVTSQTIDLNELFTDVLETTTRLEILNVERKGGIFIVEGDRMKLVSHLGHSKEFLDLHKDMRVGDCLCGLAAKTGEITISENSDKDSRHTFRYPGMTPHGHIILPLKARERVVGVMYLYLPADVRLDSEKLKMLISVGNHIGIAIDNARLYEETKALALHDSLTGLANRRLMDIVFERNFSEAKRFHSPFSVIMLDIDHFKEYNDTYGHSAGDRLLVEIANLLSKETRNIDLVVRYGGEEFLILLPETESTEAYEVAERIRKAVGSQTKVTISLGISSYHKGIQKKEDLIDKADEALYQAKQAGRNQIEMSRWRG